VKVGQLDRRIEIQRQVNVQSGTSGRQHGAWVTVATVWANVQDVMPSRDESMTANALEVSKQRARIRIRWNPVLAADCRIRISKPTLRTLQVISPPAEIGGRRNFMEFMAEEVSTGG
jgi:SPP1 family predicted phage head-tail adaptor